MAKKILIVGIHDAMGGIEQVMYDYVSRVNSGEIQFAFANMHKKIVYQDEYERMGCRIYPLPDVKRNPLGCAVELMKVIRREKFDIVHYNMLSAANIVPLVIAKIAGCKRIVAHAHNTGTVGPHKYILHCLNRIFVPPLATDLFTCSGDAGRFMFGKRKKAVLIRNAIDVKRFSYCPRSRKKIRKELGIDDDVPVVGHVGRFAEAKNHAFLLEIFRRVAQRRETAKLLLVGTGHKEQEIRCSVEKYGIADRVVFYGTSPNVHELYSAMDIFVLPSLFEGLSVVGSEAQCEGLFVIASDTVSKEMDISGLVRWRSLNDPPEEWADTVLEYLPLRKTENMSDVIANAGYDIDVEAKRLEGLYSNFA